MPGELDHTMVLVRHLECETDANEAEKCTDWNAVTCCVPRGAGVASHRRRCSAGRRAGSDSHAAWNTQAQVRVRRPAVVGQRLGDGVDCGRSREVRKFQKEWDPH